MENKNNRNTSIFDNPTGKSQFYLLVGKSERGKSHFAKFLLYDRFLHAGWKFGISFIATKYTDAYNFLPKKTIYQGYHDKVLKAWTDGLQRELKRKGKLPPSFVYFDDLVGVLTSNSKFFKNFITTFRHLNINVIISVQYLVAVSTTVRAQVNYCLMYNEKRYQTLDILYENFGGLFPTKDEFIEYLWKNTGGEKNKYVGILFVERIDNLKDNYIPIKAPARLPSTPLKFT